MSHLRKEKSPYLLQHANNPVAWYPWSDQAFANARDENKLIFLSIGYSTCHWCHVMAHECFEDDEVAALLNTDYISVKVDREERPDIDQVYMEVCQRMTGGGGWPLTIIMTPDARPFYAATYIPKNGHQDRPGLMQLLPWVAAKWRDDAEFLGNAADEIIREMQQKQTIDAQDFSLGLQERAAVALKKSFDPRFGGFGRAPKFPRPHDLSFLLQRFRLTADNKCLDIVDRTLAQMRAGGIYDQLGSGFHRYSTDEKWLLPHFEKMLYDQAGLVDVYLQAWEELDCSFYAGTARAVLAYLLRDMRSVDGAFFSAEDADSEGEEGVFYLWSKQEIVRTLGERSEPFCQFYKVKEEGNYHDEATGKRTGMNILHYDCKNDVDTGKFTEERACLFKIRSERIRPHLDDKIISGWNGMAISAFARAGKRLMDGDYIGIARETADFVLNRMVDENGRLLRRFRDEEAAILAFSEDYSYVARGLLDIYNYDLDFKWLQKAVDLSQSLIELFMDADTGGLYDSPKDGEKLLVRPHTTFDGAFAAPGSIALEVFSRLNLLTGNMFWREMAEKLMRSLSAEVSRYPAGYTQLLQSSNWLLRPAREIVIVSGDGNATEMLNVVRRARMEQTVVLHKSAQNSVALAGIAPYTEAMIPVDGRPTVYACQNFTCMAPLTDVKEFRELLETIPGKNEHL